MEDYNRDYDPQDNQQYDDDPYYDQDYYQPEQDKSVKGLKIMIVVLAVILAGLSVIYFMQVRQIRSDYAVERDTLTNRLSALVFDLDNLKTENDTITQHLEIERLKADSLMDRLQNERRWNLSKVREYEKQMGYMRTAMEGYIHMIDSLDRLNKRLGQENVQMRQQLTSSRLAVEKATEQVQEMSTQLRKGSVIFARNIVLNALSANDRVVNRGASRAARLRVDFVLIRNELADPGTRDIYARIKGPDGYVLTTASTNVFNHEGDVLTYSASRSVDYQNEDLSVSIYYNGSGITAGTYNVELYMDGHKIGESELVLR